MPLEVELLLILSRNYCKISALYLAFLQICLCYVYIKCVNIYVHVAYYNDMAVVLFGMLPCFLLYFRFWCAHTSWVCICCCTNITVS